VTTSHDRAEGGGTKALPQVPLQNNCEGLSQLQNFPEGWLKLQPHLSLSLVLLPCPQLLILRTLLDKVPTGRALSYSLRLLTPDTWYQKWSKKTDLKYGLGAGSPTDLPARKLPLVVGDDYG
jgi:hypothetical protein